MELLREESELLDPFCPPSELDSECALLVSEVVELRTGRMIEAGLSSTATGAGDGGGDSEGLRGGASEEMDWLHDGTCLMAVSASAISDSTLAVS